MGLREAAAERYAAEQAAIEAERLADEAKQAEIDEQRREQRRRAAEKVLAELVLEADISAEPVTLVGHSNEHEWLPAHSVALEYDGLLFVWQERSSLRAELPGNEWSTRGGPGTLRLYTRCEGCRQPLESTVIVDLASVGEFLAQPIVASHSVHIDDDPELPTVLCTATDLQIAEARAGYLEAAAETAEWSERRYITTVERRALDLLLDLRHAVSAIDEEREAF